MSEAATEARSGPPGEAARAEPVLIGDRMTGGYGTGADILHACTIAVDKGQIAVIVGPNGAGKSTAMKAIFGMLRLREGHVRLNGRDITRLSPQARVAQGMAFVPQNNNIFPSMTVEENLEMGAFLRETASARPWSRCSSCFRSCAKSAARRRANCPAGSASRSRWGAR
jgi:branched-chain amino acid transport system ATP-binding protein